MSFREDNLPMAKLLLNPNNYRFQETKEFVYADQKRFHEDSVQNRAYKTLRTNASVEQLKASIIRNGFIPVEKLVVRKFTDSPERFLVIEGNRRLAALRWIDEDDKAGVNVPESVKTVFAGIPVVVVEGEESALTYKALMGIRHVSGINQWGGYQRAKLVVELKDEFSLDSADVAERLGMTAHEVNRRFRGFKALSQMQNDEEYSEFSNPDLYPLFHEAVALPSVRDWLGWVEESSAFKNTEELHRFYSLLVPTEIDEGQTKDPKITTKDQVRELRSILVNKEAKTLLFDPAKTFLDAMSVAKHEDISKSWLSNVASAIDSLQRIGVFEVMALTTEQLSEVEKLRDVSAQLLASYEKLKK